MLYFNILWNGMARGFIFQWNIKYEISSHYESLPLPEICSGKKYNQSVWASIFLYWTTVDVGGVCLSDFQKLNVVIETEVTPRPTGSGLEVHVTETFYYIAEFDLKRDESLTYILSLNQYKISLWPHCLVLFSLIIIIIIIWSTTTKINLSLQSFCIICSRRILCYLCGWGWHLCGWVWAFSDFCHDLLLSTYYLPSQLHVAPDWWCNLRSPDVQTRSGNFTRVNILSWSRGCEGREGVRLWNSTYTTAREPREISRSSAGKFLISTLLIGWAETLQAEQQTVKVRNIQDSHFKSHQQTTLLYIIIITEKWRQNKYNK